MAHTCVADALLAGDSRSLAGNVDDIYREGSSSLVRTQLTGELLLPDDGLIRFEATRHHDGLRSDESSRLGYEYVSLESTRFRFLAAKFWQRSDVKGWR